MEGGDEGEGRKLGWPSLTKWGSVICGFACAAAGLFAFISQFIPSFNTLLTPLTFLVYIYICAFGVFLVMAELNRPECFMNACDFMRGPRFRSFFILILATLTLNAGFTGNRNSPANITLLVVGFTTLMFSFMTCIFGSYIDEDEVVNVVPSLRKGSGKPSRGVSRATSDPEAGKSTGFTSQI